MLDARLQPFVDAETDDEAEQALDRLIADQAWPLIEKIVARKLDDPTRGGRQASAAEDRDDVANEAALALIRRLWELRRGPEAGGIERLDDYVASVAHSACVHYIRRVHPRRARLKARLRHLLGHHRAFALWRTTDARSCCGVADWHGRDPDAGAERRLAALAHAPHEWPETWFAPLRLDQADPAPLLSSIFMTIEGPVETDGVIGLVAGIWRVDRQPASGVELLPEQLPDPAASAEWVLDRQRFARRLWHEIQLLPVRQRMALLLNLRNAQGAGVLWMLPATGVASLRGIAAALELPVDELAALWPRLPIDDAAIAARMGLARQQVINLRLSARKRLMNRLGAAAPAGAAGAAAAARRAPRANTPVRSSSSRYEP